MTRSSPRLRQLYLASSPQPVNRSVATLGDEPLLVGRDPGERGLLVPDPEASRAHARVERDPRSGATVITDLGSQHGLYVDATACARAELRHGSVVRVGNSLLVFADTERPDEASLRPESGALLGFSLAMQRLRGEIERVAHGEGSVLLVGEAGVGKHLCAEQIHVRSGRAGDLVVLGEDPDAALAVARGGTLYIPEVADLPTSVLTTLLATPEVRVVAATRGDWGVGVDAAAALLELPSLRARREDVLRLADGLLLGQALWRPIAPGAAEALLVHDWPGNVRELGDVLAAAAQHAPGGDSLRLEHLPDAIAARVLARGHAPPAPRVRASGTLPGPMRQLPPPRHELLRVLEEFDGNLQLVADYYGKDRRQVHRWLEKEGIGG